MTCIIAMTYKGKVHMIGDCEGSDGFIKAQYKKNPKCFKNGDFLVGHTTTFRLGQILQYEWNVPEKLQSQSENDYLYKTVIKSLKSTFDNNFFGHKDGVDFEGGTFILGYKGRICVVESNLQLLEYEDYASCGCGAYHANAAMEAFKLTGWEKTRPEFMMLDAGKIAQKMVTGVNFDHYTYISE